jgi:sn-glycerol 3-phosphate transport system substrate-binding protein
MPGSFQLFQLFQLLRRAGRVASLLCIAIAIAAPASAARAAVNIELWHSLAGAGAAELDRIAGEFNASQQDYIVQPLHKGNERETLQAGLSAQRQGHAPHLLQVQDSLTAKLAASPRSFVPVYQVMERARQPLNAASFLPLVGDGSKDPRGRLVSLPFTAATPLLYYNRDALKAAGVDDGAPLDTWLNVQAVALKVIDSGASCAFTTESPSWVHVENLFAWHNEPLASVRNGPRGKEIRLAFNSRLMILHIGLLSSWVSSGLFSYFGSLDEAERKFAAGECAMLTGSSSSIMDLRSKAQFALGVAPLPVHSDFAGVHTGTAPHGASLWVMSGKKPAEYAGVARFLAYLSRPAVQAQWHQATGYLPTTQAAVDLSRQQGFYERDPEAAIAVRALRSGTTPRFAQAPAVRGVVDEELEAVWARRKTPMEGMDAALARANKLLGTLPASVLK